MLWWLYRKDSVFRSYLSQILPDSPHILPNFTSSLCSLTNKPVSPVSDACMQMGVVESFGWTYLCFENVYKVDSQLIAGLNTTQ